MPNRSSNRNRGLSEAAPSWDQQPAPRHPVSRFRVGSARATVLSDGSIPFGDVYAAFSTTPAATVGALLDAARIEPGDMRLPQNNLLLDMDGHRILFETGKGPVTLPGYRTGKLMPALQAAGIEPGSITDVVMSHAHSDHCGGIVAADGRVNFPNARYHLSHADFDYWTDPQRVPPHQAAWLEIARHNLLPVKDRLHLFAAGDMVLPGVHSVSTPGHTVGHVGFDVTAGEGNLCLIGDLAHHHVLLLERPELLFVHDTDPAQSAASRFAELTRLATQRMRMFGYHFPWPGLGHVAPAGTGFRFIPERIDSDFELHEAGEATQ